MQVDEKSREVIDLKYREEVERLRNEFFE